MLSFRYAVRSDGNGYGLFIRGRQRYFKAHVGKHVPFGVRRILVEEYHRRLKEAGLS